MNEQPSYYSILTASVRYDNRLSDSEKILYSEITSLSNKYGYCTATNNYFSELYNVSKRTISTRINNLKKLGYLNVKVELEGKKVKQRKIYPMTNISAPIEENFHRGIEENFHPPMERNFAGNNTSNNNTSNNNTSVIDNDNNEVVKKLSDKDPVAKTLSLIQNNYYNQITPIKIQNLVPEIESIGGEAYDIVSIAIDYTKEKNKNLNYLIKIINNWSDEGIITVDQAKQKVSGKPKQSKSNWIEDELSRFGNEG